jgi:uncharacterized membrane protein (UPF0127 family)
LGYNSTMIFKLFFDLIKKVGFIIPVSVLVALGLVAWRVYPYLSAATNPESSQDLITRTVISYFTGTTPTPSTTPQKEKWPDTVKVKMTNLQTSYLFTTEVADTLPEQQLGYMSRESLPEYNAMIFVYETNQTVPFWMKNVNFPLDMIFLDENYKIIEIKHNVPPCKQSDITQQNCPFYPPRASYRYVIEMLGGNCAKLNINENTKVEILK